MILGAALEVVGAAAVILGAFLWAGLAGLLLSAGALLMLVGYQIGGRQ